MAKKPVRKTTRRAASKKAVAKKPLRKTTTVAKPARKTVRNTPAVSAPTPRQNSKTPTPRNYFRAVGALRGFMKLYDKIKPLLDDIDKEGLQVGRPVGSTSEAKVDSAKVDPADIDPALA